MGCTSFLSRSFLSLVPLLIFLSSSSARAESIAGDAVSSDPPAATAPVEEPASAREIHTHWYGWQTLLVDAGGLAMMSIGANARSTNLTAIGIGVYALGPPLVHMGQGRPAMAITDLGLRAIAPVVMGGTFLLLGGASDSECRSGCYLAVIGLEVGVLLGGAAAIAIDASVIARERVVTPPKTASVRWSPTLAPQRGGGTLGAVGAF